MSGGCDRVDYIVFMVDMTNGKSWEFIRKYLSFKYVDPEYFVGGKICVIATRG